jgi:hypothetical protein
MFILSLYTDQFQYLVRNPDGPVRTEVPEDALGPFVFARCQFLMAGLERGDTDPRVLAEIAGAFGASATGSAPSTW